MPAPESRTDPTAIPRNAFASVWGVFIGLFFGVPPAWGAHDMGLPWAPYGLSVIAMCVVAGLLIAFTVDAMIPRGRRQATEVQDPATSDQPLVSSNPRRLPETKTPLDRFDMWSDLLELEVQDLDEKMSRFRERHSSRPK